MDAFPECEHIGLAIWYTQIYAILSFGVLLGYWMAAQGRTGKAQSSVFLSHMYLRGWSNSVAVGDGSGRSYCGKAM